MTGLNVALVQLEPVLRDRATALEQALAACRAAKDAGAHVALFPEMWSIGYDLREGEPPERLAEHAMGREDPFLDGVSSLAAGLDLAIAVGFLERWEPQPRDSVAIFDRTGALSLLYAKVHTCDFDLEAALTPGRRFEVCELDTAVGVVRVGAMICFDMVFPEAARVLMLQGAEVILVPNACPLEPWRAHVAETRAIENMVAIAVTNYAGEGYRGGSFAFQPAPYALEGEEEGAIFDTLIARAGTEAEICCARIDLDRLRLCRATETQGDAFRKPSANGRIVDRHVDAPFRRPQARR
jgi:predicted amidohydrolase